MKPVTFAALFLMVAASIGCASTFTKKHTENGVLVEDDTTKIGFLDVSSETKRYTQKYPLCLHGIGEMPGNEEVGHCVENVRGTMARTDRVLNVYAYPYGYYGYYGGTTPPQPAVPNYMPPPTPPADVVAPSP